MTKYVLIYFPVELPKYLKTCPRFEKVTLRPSCVVFFFLAFEINRN